jgi:glycerate-2-kinase
MVQTMTTHNPAVVPVPTCRIRLLEGAADNLPDAAANTAAAEVLRLAQAATADTLTIFLVSGGGSALLPLPAKGITLAEKTAATKVLATRGASIDELNTVRKHISAVKGGWSLLPPLVDGLG